MRTPVIRSLFRSEFTICGQVREDNVAPIPNVVIPNAQLLEFLGSKDLWWSFVREVHLQNALRIQVFRTKILFCPDQLKILKIS